VRTDVRATLDEADDEDEEEKEGTAVVVGSWLKSTPSWYNCQASGKTVVVDVHSRSILDAREEADKIVEEEEFTFTVVEGCMVEVCSAKIWTVGPRCEHRSLLQ